MLRILIGFLLLAGSFAFGDQWDKKTVLTLNETVQVPGAVLEPGKYVIKLLSSDSFRHIVQITNERENHVYTTVLAIPNYRLTPTGDSEFGWWETPAGNPKAIRAWFYPGDNFGQEFAYPKGMSAKLAQTAQVAVPSITAQTPAELKTAPVTEVEPTGEVRELAKETYTPPEAATNPQQTSSSWKAVEPQPEPVTPEPAPTQAAAPAAAVETPQLPKTASPFAAIGLGGLLALATGFALRALGKHSA